MANLDKVIDTFLDGDYFIIFMLLMFIIIIVLIIALFKSKEDSVRVVRDTDFNRLDNENQDNFFDELDSLKATTKDDIIDEEKPLIKQISIPEVKTYDDIISGYEDEDEENAVISANELEQRTKNRMNELGTNNNKIAIEKYEEEQENKAIISYEQLLKNANNITLSYKEEEKKNEDAPRINKIEITQKEVSEPENYLEEEEFLKILKSFRMSL